jgi:hypothetical protein
MRILLAATLILALAGCATGTRSERDLRRAAEAANWHASVTDADRKRLREWRGDFARALQKARAAGHGAAIDAEGRLLLPDAAIPGALPNGNYRCRMIKLGARGEGLLDYVAYPGFPCRVTRYGAIQYLAKLGGSQRPVGRIYPADAMRGVFLGMLMLGDETRPMRYGSDPERSLAGWVERVGERQWRIVFPAPHFESLTDVMELVPAS